MKEQKENRINPGPVFIKVGDSDIININQIISINCEKEKSYVTITISAVDGGYNHGSESKSLAFSKTRFEKEVLPYLNVINLD